MASRRKAGDAVSRLPSISRRAMLGGVSTTPALAAASAGVPADPIVEISQHWLRVEAERDRLGLAWGRLDGALSKSHGWYRLSAQERAAIPEGRPLEEIAARLEQLDWQSQAILDALPKAPAATPAGIVASLTIAATLLRPEDHELEHDLVSRAIVDLRALAGLR
jgi:hypothetical protein